MSCCPIRPPIAPMFCRAAAAVLSLLLVATTQAEQVRYYPDGQVPSPFVVAGILAHGRPVGTMKMRGGDHDEPATVANDGGEFYDALTRERALSASAQAAVQAWQARLDTAPATHGAASARSTSALAVTVGFDNDSAKLQAATLPSLDAIAEGMRLVGFSRPFVIEGHTSASGSAAHNRTLSRLRAESVKRYLVREQLIPAAALRTAGLGSSAPLDRKDPDAAVNRRVQFRAV